jgi:sugar phosphate isomerase/epimerase
MSLLRCFSSLGCPEYSLDETLALAVKHGVSAVELRALGGTMDLPGYFRAEFGTPGELAGRLARSAARVVAFNASLHLIGTTGAEREQLAALAEWADALGVRWLRVFDGGKHLDAAELAQAAETRRWWQALRHERGWQTDLMVETHDSLFTSAAVNRFLAAVPGVAVLWDAHHTWKKGGEDPVMTWRAIRSAVVHVHVKDSIGVPSARHAFTYVLPGDGQFPIGALVQALEADAFEGPVSLEWEKLWHPHLPSLDEALATAQRRAWW